jgi:hypothetical protein
MNFLADILLAFKDFISGSLTKSLVTAAKWTSPVFPWSAGIGLTMALFGNVPAAMYGVFVIPGALLLAGASYGLVTGGVQEVLHGMETRRLNRMSDEKERVVTRPEPRPIAPAPSLYPDMPTENLRKSYADPHLAFRESRPKNQVMSPHWQGKCTERKLTGHEMLK